MIYQGIGWLCISELVHLHQMHTGPLLIGCYRAKICLTSTKNWQHRTILFWKKPGLELHYTTIQSPVSPLIGTARSKLIILSSKFEISTKKWVKLSLHWPFWAKSFKIFIFNVPKQQKCTFEGHDLVMPWGVRGFQAFISSPLMIFWSKKLIWWVLRPMFLLLNLLQKTA